jgi:hypothetical protein
MHRPLKFATLIAVALALTACADSVPRGITEPDGLRLSSHLVELSDAQQALLAEIREVQETLYACDKSPRKRQLDNKKKDINEMEEYAKAGFWDIEDNSGKNVPTKANQIINDTKGLVQNGTIPLNCPENATDGYGGKSRTDLANYFYLLLELFASKGESLAGEFSGVVACPETGCEELTDEWGVNVPDGTFGETVVILVQENKGAFPDLDNFNPVGNSFHFDVFPATAVAKEPGWTRCIVWEGFSPENELPDVGSVKMVRQDGESGAIVELHTEARADNKCGDQLEDLAMRNRLLRGAYKLLAGFPFLPKELHAYSPPRTFGGTSTTSSPHWLTVAGCDLACLRDLTVEYYGDYPQNTNAALGHLDAAALCDAEDVECWNSSLDSYINVVSAQTGTEPGKVLSPAQGEHLITIALALKK